MANQGLFGLPSAPDTRRQVYSHIRRRDTLLCSPLVQPGSVTAGSVTVLNRFYFTPVRLDTTAWLSGLSWSQWSAAASGNVLRYGIAAAMPDTNMPGAVLFQATATADTAGLKTIVCSNLVKLQAGALYWLFGGMHGSGSIGQTITCSAHVCLFGIDSSNAGSSPSGGTQVQMYLTTSAELQTIRESDLSYEVTSQRQPCILMKLQPGDNYP